jgi:hypothetical protein
MRFRIKDFENRSFGLALGSEGVVGTVVRQLSLTDWGDDWLLLQLQRPFSYEGRQHNQILVRSREQGHPLGGSQPTSVFTLLIIDPSVLEYPEVSSKDFDFVSWSEATTLPE